MSRRKYPHGAGILVFGPLFGIAFWIIVGLLVVAALEVI